MDDVDIIRIITGRAPTEEQIVRIRMIASALSIGENDAFLTIIMALDAYHGAISDIPKRIDEAGRTAIDSAQAIATSSAVHAASVAREHIAQAVDVAAFQRSWRASVVNTMIAMACMVFFQCIVSVLLIDHRSTEMATVLNHAVEVLPEQIKIATTQSLQGVAKLAASDTATQMNGVLSETIADRVDKTLDFVKPQLPFVHALISIEAQSPGVLSILANKNGIMVARLLKANDDNACPLIGKTLDGKTTCTFIKP